MTTSSSKPKEPEVIANVINDGLLLEGDSDDYASEPEDPDDETAMFNIAGQLFEIPLSLLLRKPGTRLCKVAKFFHKRKHDVYFFDRHPSVFSAIMDYYRSGDLHMPLNVCGAVVKRELDYWQIDESLIMPCCWTDYSSYIDNNKILAEFTRSVEEETEIAQKYETLTGWPKKKMKIWMTLDHPKSSKTAMGLAITSFIFITISIAGFCMETLPVFQQIKEKKSNCTLPKPSKINVTEIKLTKPHIAFEYLDMFTTAFFSFELMIRVIFAPSKIKFFTSLMNFIDMVALVPLYGQLFIRVLDGGGCVLNQRAIIETLYVLRIVRIFRIFHLVKHYNALTVLVHSIKSSVQELLMLCVFLLIVMVISATLVYFAETDRTLTGEKSGDFTTIPIGFWWAIITMTTVGYGDVVPKTSLGYCVGTACALCGVLLVALTIPIISNNFELFYNHARTRTIFEDSQARARDKKNKNKPDLIINQNLVDGVLQPLMHDDSNDENNM